MIKKNIALGFYQNLATANTVLKEIQRKGLGRLAYVHRTSEGRLVVSSFFPSPFLITLVATLLAVIAVLVFFMIRPYFGLGWEIFLAALILTLAGLSAFGIIRLLSVPDANVINRYKRVVGVGEGLVLVEVAPRHEREVLRIMRLVKTGHPISFLLRHPSIDGINTIELQKEPLTLDQLRQQAIDLATSLQQTYVGETFQPSLLKRLKKSARILSLLRRNVAEGEYVEQTLTLSAEWLLDNTYVIQGSIEEIQRNLPLKFYRELPKILRGPLKGLPRIYACAVELVHGTAGKLSRESIIEFIKSYQTVHPLTIGELWALALLLRLRLIECVQFLAVEIDRRMREGELASFWGNRLLQAARREPERLPEFFALLDKEFPIPSAHFAEELLEHLFDEEAALVQAKKWIELRFGIPSSDVIHQEQINEAAEQVVFSNAITSLITLSQLSWQDIFETLSPVDAILKDDPVDIYSKMDFTTRNLYRESIEVIARYSHLLEVEIAKRAIQSAQEGQLDFDRHVGYYLVDEGRRKLEATAGYAPPLLQSLRRWITGHPASIYLGGIAIGILVLEIGIVAISLKYDVGLFQTIFFAFLALIPVSELVIQFMNLFVTRLIPPSILPKMLFENAIPTEDKTLVVVPMLLLGQEEIQAELDRLEIRYLANPDPMLYFGLFSDFTDAPEQHTSADAALLEVAVKGIVAFDNKYGPGKFFLFHRQRVWSHSEKAWIGWERKRGKLEKLNRFLMGEQLEENIVYAGKAEALKGLRYVITLDSDTQLPKNQAKRLIEVSAHPLNRPQFSADGRKVIRGFTLIQPRVCTDFPHTKASLFSRIFSEPLSIDPYTQAISNVYQDLEGEGIYHGKGIYDLAAFHRLLSGRFKEEHLLSHDLIEGTHVRVGFASNVVLFDLIPEEYFCWAKRLHRWIRGDWQIVDWLFPQVPLGNHPKEPNPLSAINRWKIFDNLRRSLIAPSLMVLLISAWLLSPISALWTAVSALVIFMPALFLLVCTLLDLAIRLRITGEELKLRIYRALITVATLPHEALLSVDAICRVAYRRIISHTHLLQWNTSQNGNRINGHAYRRHLLSLGWSSLFAVAVFALVAYINPSALPLALPFCLLWASVPLIVYVIDRPIDKKKDAALTSVDKNELRLLARKTWRYFDDFVGPESHWLPPDNYQMALKVEIAPRTSPTNIGLWLLALLNAHDFKYLTSDAVIDKIVATTDQMKKMERFEGHLLNWYDTQTLNPLYPRYISTVDSGNLLACLWTLQEGVYEMIAAPLLATSTLEGIKDVCEILAQESIGNKDVKTAVESIKAVSDTPKASLVEIVESIKSALQVIQECQIVDSGEEPAWQYWFKQLSKQLAGWEDIIIRYYSWLDVLNELTREQLDRLDSQAWKWREDALAVSYSLQMIAEGALAKSFSMLQSASQNAGLPADLLAWGKRFQEALLKAQWLAGEKLGAAEEALKELDMVSQEMNLGFLYNQDRKVFAIGYNVDERRLDNSYYDLLASEARMASLVAIAKDDAPIEHWWGLGRPYNVVNGITVLMSWGGTMFEYLMPALFNRHHPNSLLGEACEAAVTCQIRYGRKRGIPWGISEAAFSAIDVHKTYQYRSFGVPGLGLKRGLEDDLVVSPYSSALALVINAPEALKNLRKLAGHAHINLLGPYGYFESIDYTRQHGPGGERGVIIYAYMAHHQGMILTAINNVLNNDPIPRRFHKDPRIKGVESLLYERTPMRPIFKGKGLRKESPVPSLKPFSPIPIMGVSDSAESVTPKVNLFSNGNYSLMVTNAGGGFSRWRDIAITRWRADTTCDQWGSFCYLKDTQSSLCWSAGYQPMQSRGKQYTTSFKTDKAEFRRNDDGIETFTEIVVSPEDNAEIRFISLANLSNVIRTIELTSYMELALAPHNADRAHPCFNKLFIETEALPELSGLIAFRRLRSPDEQPLYAAHVMAFNSECAVGELQYETDRSRFIGRGRSLQNPVALAGELSNSVGTVLDPIFSLRQRFTLQPGQRIQLSFVTAIADNRDAVVALMNKYKDLAASHRAIELAWTYAQLELRHLRIHEEDVQLFQKLASRVLYPHSQLRASAERLRSNTLGQSKLWGHGISGDLPIVVVMVGDVYDADLVKQALIAHTFWRLRGFKTDLVIINEEPTAYEHPLLEQLGRMVQAYAYRGEIDCPGGVFLRTEDHIADDELTLLLTAARAILVAARGSLRQQLVSPMPATTYPAKLVVNRRMIDEPSTPLPFLELPYFNGLGGYTPDGSSYDIYLGPNTNTPLPWINVIANPQFGMIVTEAGIGCSWYGNSQSYRLTPWSNDPILNPITDALYIRDEELGSYWTPTPAPIRELDAYRISHGQGFTTFEHNSHGIEQNLLVFVPVDENGGLPVRIQRLRLVNRSSRRRRLSVTSYSELVLGGDKEDTQMFVVTDWDSESQGLFAYNRYHPDFGDRVAFSSSITPATSYTGDRTEFIGRNSSLVAPAAMKRVSLSGHSGAGMDPCAALQALVEIEAGQQAEVVFILGSAADAAAARKLILQIRTEGIESLLQKTKDWWSAMLGSIQVELPDAAMNFALNRWLLYQNLSCRYWGRAAFYQSSGAYGYRDQLQDVMAMVYALPDIARKHILLAASRQFVEGDVQHWWHAQSGGGIRTRITDDLLWLPYAVAHYVRTTGDISILDEVIHFIQGPALTEDQHEVYFVPEISSESATLLEHCRRAIQKGLTAGSHGLPLIGGGDWNDGMNRVGIKGKGESVWLAWFLIHVMNDFADLLACKGDQAAGEGFRLQTQRLAKVVEESGWDGGWYRRAYFDDGTPLGSKNSPECTIDSLAQSWAVISGAAMHERSKTAIDAADAHLVLAKEGVVRLLTPPFNIAPLDPGYIKGYPPGVRENGGQYTHGSLWLAMAYARKGDGDKAAALLRMMHPISHTPNMDEVWRYKVEPYIVAADIYDLPGQVGRGGWTWYTGSAAWMYRIWLEEVLGFKLRGQVLRIECALPKAWEQVKLRYRHQSSHYEITIENPHHLSSGKARIELDGIVLSDQDISLVDDGLSHIVRIVLEPPNP